VATTTQRVAPAIKAVLACPGHLWIGGYAFLFGVFCWPRIPASGAPPAAHRANNLVKIVLRRPWVAHCDEIGCVLAHGLTSAAQGFRLVTCVSVIPVERMLTRMKTNKALTELKH